MDHGGSADPTGFGSLFQILSAMEMAQTECHERPGVSLPCWACGRVAEDPGERWLSVCFSEDTIAGPDEQGDRIPGELLESGGYGFDVSATDDRLLVSIQAHTGGPYRRG